MSGKFSAAFFSWKCSCLAAARRFADGDFFFFHVLSFTGSEELTLSIVIISLGMNFALHIQNQDKIVVPLLVTKSKNENFCHGGAPAPSCLQFRVYGKLILRKYFWSATESDQSV